MKPFAIFAALVVAIVASNSLFTVRENEYAVLFQFGAIKRSDYAPGLHVKAPFVQNVRKFDKRLLTVDSEPERYLTSERKDVLVDFYAKWRIADVARFYSSFQGDEALATQRLLQIVREPLRQAFQQRKLQEVVAGRGDLILQVVKLSDDAARALGIEVVDVRMIRIDLPEDGDVLPSVFNRMRTERQQVANDLRGQGQEASETIRSDADRQSRVLLAEAQRDAQKIRGEGDARAAEIYARAYNTDPEFYAFNRSLEAYRESFRGKDGVLVLDKNSEFFRYFGEDARR
ncbi:MAG: protease modulator HflC [Pseudomonadota bacterium]|jgi:membrane protease subunit HflC